MNNTIAKGGIGLLKALLVSYVVTVVFLLLLALGLYKFQISETIVTMGIMTTYGVSNLIGGRIFAGNIGKRRILCGVILSIAYLLILIGTSLIMNKGIIEGGGLVKAVIISIIGGIAGGFVSPVKNF